MPTTGTHAHRQGQGRVIAGDFRPPWWLRSPHLQTLWPTALSTLERLRDRRILRPERDLQRRRIELADGDFIDLSIGRATGPRVLILHGLEGGLDSHYARRLVHQLNLAGFQPVFMHLRGTSGTPNRLPRSYHSGATEDLSEVLVALAQDRAGPVRHAIGFSLGGNLLLKYLGERDQTSLEQAVAVSVPFVLRDAMLRLNLGFSRLYRHHLLRRLKASHHQKFRHRDAPIQVNLSAIRNFDQFDEQITAPLNGFAGAFDYYQRCSCRRYLATIDTPTRIIHSLDDPFMFPSTVPQAHELGPGITLELTTRGGHVGFIAAHRGRNRPPWLEQRILCALQSKRRG